jgi:hypothetical protein
MKAANVSSLGLRQTDPVADNNIAISQKQQSSVEILVSGSSIGTKRLIAAAGASAI